MFFTLTVFPPQAQQTTHYGHHWWNCPVCKGDAEPEARTSHAEDLYAWHHSCHAWSGWWAVGNGYAAIFGAQAYWGQRSRTDHRGKDSEEADIGFAQYPGSPCCCGCAGASWDQGQSQTSNACWAEKPSQPLTCIMKETAVTYIRFDWTCSIWAFLTGWKRD